MKNKIVPVDKIADRVGALREAGRKIVATNGCFDILHVGHVRYLETARALGDALVVAINADDSVRRLKGTGRPINNENDRAEVIAALSCVDLVTIFPEVRATQILESIAPAIYAKGGDYRVETLDPEERQVLQKIGAEIRIVPFTAGYSTSQLLQKLRGVE